MAQRRQEALQFEATDFYAVLNLESTASVADVRKQFRSLALQWHPDKHAGGSEAKATKAKEIFQQLNAAHEVLTDAERRPRYDEVWRRVHSKKPHAVPDWAQRVSRRGSSCEPRMRRAPSSDDVCNRPRRTVPAETLSQQRREAAARAPKKPTAEEEARRVFAEKERKAREGAREEIRKAKMRGEGVFRHTHKNSEQDSAKPTSKADAGVQSTRSAGSTAEGRRFSSDGNIDGPPTPPPKYRTPWTGRRTGTPPPDLRSAGSRAAAAKPPQPSQQESQGSTWTEFAGFFGWAAGSTAKDADTASAKDNSSTKQSTAAARSPLDVAETSAKETVWDMTRDVVQRADAFGKAASDQMARDFQVTQEVASQGLHSLSDGVKDIKKAWSSLAGVVSSTGPWFSSSTPVAPRVVEYVQPSRPAPSICPRCGALIIGSSANFCGSCLQVFH
eukprot:TRINITY_DN16586_c1_g1_i2.p1 TRINITY_DN16586_c1_g1~~TRINITY_DN16586_c1_g1_i2.p1  ORF type:complete len:445 (-),score=73.16 TRINITY_DN16586_c1_g1_i2:301-1635(-)